MLLRSTVRNLAYAGAARKVCAVFEVVEQWALRLHALAYEIGRKW